MALVHRPTAAATATAPATATATATATVSETRSALDLAALIAALADPTAERRRAAAVGLDGAAEAIPALLAALPRETDPAVRDAMLTTLAAHDTAEVAAGLAAHLRSDDVGLRTAVVEALAAMPGGVLPLLPHLVIDPDHGVRVLTAMILGHLATPLAVPWLVDIVGADPHPNVVGTALEALLPAATTEHIILLEQTRARLAGDPFLRFTIEAALLALRGESP